MALHEKKGGSFFKFFERVDVGNCLSRESVQVYRAALLWATVQHQLWREVSALRKRFPMALQRLLAASIVTSSIGIQEEFGIQASYSSNTAVLGSGV